LVVIRRCVFREETEVRVPITLSHIAEDLVVRAVLFDDVDDVLDVGPQESHLHIGDAVG